MTTNVDSSNNSTPRFSPRSGVGWTAQGNPQDQQQQQQAGQGGGGQGATTTQGQQGAPTVQTQVQLPPPTATLALEIHNTVPLNEQGLYSLHNPALHFPNASNIDLSLLNSPANHQATCMVNILDTGNICILLSLGLGTNPIGEVSPISNHVLTLTGDGSTFTPPQVLLLPKKVADPLEIRIPLETEFNAKIMTTSRFHLFKNAEVPETVITLKIMPIINFLIYDGFDQDLDAVVVYK